MANQLSRFARLEETDGLFTAQNGKLRGCAIALSTGAVCLFNPVAGLNDEARASIDEIGEVTHLLTPNHYHNKALAEYADLFPEARLVASDGAIPRLQKITQLPIKSLVPLLALLPSGITVLYPAGLKTGEIWLRAQTNDGVAWFVGDAFCTTKSKSIAKVADTPELLGTFPRYGVADQPVYLEWVNSQIDRDNPTMIVPCHGQVIVADDLNAKLRKLLRG